jgi:hypothetical protein
VTVQAADEAQRLIAGCARVVELEGADFEPYRGVMSAAKPTGESLAAELEARRRLHAAVDDPGAVRPERWRQRDPAHAGAGIDPAHLTRMCAHTVETPTGHYTHALGCWDAAARTAVGS